MWSLQRIGSICLLFIVVLLVVVFNWIDLHNFEYKMSPEAITRVKKTMLDRPSDGSTMHLAVVSCGDRAPEAVTMIRSVLMFSRRRLHIYVFADTQSEITIRTMLEEFPDHIQTKFEYSIHDIVLPREHLPQEWNNSFKPCCTQRLFLPDLLPGVDRVIYSDTDMLHLAPLDELWQEFDAFNSAQIAGVAWHNEDTLVRTYSNPPFPYFQPFGLNSGLVLMDLPRMRAANWTAKMAEHFSKYKDVLSYGDQDLFNIFFYYQPEMLYKVDCKYNYRICHCFNAKTRSCQTALLDGPSILHGTVSVFRMDKPGRYPSFYIIGQFFSKYDFEQPFELQLRQMLQKLENITAADDKCYSVIETIPKRMSQLLTGSVTQAAH